jgi:hypothetical protein
MERLVVVLVLLCCFVLVGCRGDEGNEIEVLERKLKENPQDLVTREALMDHYFGLSGSSESARVAWKKHAVWMVKNSSKEEFSGFPFPSLDPLDQQEEAKLASELWLEIVDANKDDAKVLGKAAHFFSFHSLSKAKELLERAIELEPDNPKWQDYHDRLFKSNYMGNPEGK